MAEFLLDKLQAMGYQPAYLSRGYGRSSTGFLRVPPSGGDAERYGDEARQVAQRFPQLKVAVCEDRVAGVRSLLELEGPPIDVVVLDDAFQHRRIARDLDLVLVDANRPPWTDLLLPAGNLREFRRGLRRADMVVFTKFEEAGEARRWLPRLPQGMATAGFRLVQEAPRPFWQGRSYPAVREVHAFAGLGNNAFFFRQLREAFPGLGQCHSFPDHHDYSLEELRKILEPIKADMENSSNLGSALILTSEKDYQRLQGKEWLGQFEDFALHYVPARFVPEWGAEDLERMLAQTLYHYHGKNQRSS